MNVTCLGINVTMDTDSISGIKPIYRINEADFDCIEKKVTSNPLREHFPTRGDNWGKEELVLEDVK